jgi:hypothetical protein
MNKQIQGLKTNEKDEQFVTLLDLLKEIYCDKNITEKTKPREKAITHFNSLLRMRINYDKLKYDVCLKYDGTPETDENKKSLLVKSLFTDITHYDNALWEHTIHLVYLTAYGTIRQWTDMWEEYMLIKSNLTKADGQNVANAIENYIIDLQSKSKL